MRAVAIRTANLGKRYALRHHQESDSIRGEVSRRLGRLVRGETATERRHVWALRHVSFDVLEGEVVGIVGPNGAGKTTLGKVLSKITRPTEGYADLRGRFGSLFDVGLGFHWELTGRENLRLGAAMLGMDQANFDRELDAIVAFAGLEPFLDTPIKAFSTGMNLRLAFSLAVHNDCEILMVDEVLTVGDAAFQQRCLRRLRDLASEGRTILIVSHQLQVLRELCGRVMRLEHGGIVAFGPAADVLDRYAADKAGQSDAPAGGLVEPDRRAAASTAGELAVEADGSTGG